MDTIIDFLMTYGYGGMAMAAFVAGSVFPFSSETILAGLQLAGLHPLPLFLSATLGNVLGSMFNYWIGSFGKLEWIERYLHVGRDKVEKTRLWLQGRGAWMGVLLPSDTGQRTGRYVGVHEGKPMVHPAQHHYWQSRQVRHTDMGSEGHSDMRVASTIPHGSP